MGSLPMLSILVFLPAVVGLLLTFVPKEQAQVVKGVALAVSLVELVLSLVLWFQYEPGAGLQFVEDHAWIPQYGVRYHLGVDGLALSMLVLTGLTQPLAILASWRSIVKEPKGFFIAVLFLETGMMGVFSAADLFLFYVFWEIMLIPMALMIGIWGGPRRIYASVKFVIYTMTGSLLMFVAILYCYWQATKAGQSTFDIATLQAILPPRIPLAAQQLLFFAFALSFAIKVPMFPVHTWLPDAHVEAPTAGSVILAAVLLKMGGYGFLRFAIPFFPDAAQWAAPIMMTLSAIGIVYGSLMCMAQTDIKKLIAYSSVAHLGFVMLGIFSGTVIGMQGGVLQMINHGVSTGALFLLVGVIYERAHTRGVTDFGGLAKIMPTYAVLFLIVTLSSIGLPGTNGFAGEFLILLGSFQRFPVATTVSAIGVVLGAVYMLTLYRNMFYGKPNPKWAKLPDPNGIELASLAPLIVLIFAIGLFPNAILKVTEPSVTKVAQSLGAETTASLDVPADGGAR